MTSQMLHAQDGKGLIHVVPARLVYLLGKTARGRHTVRIRITDLETKRFHPKAQHHNLKKALQNSGVPVLELPNIINELWKEPSMRSRWVNVNKPTSKPQGLDLACSVCGACRLHQHQGIMTWVLKIWPCSTAWPDQPRCALLNSQPASHII